MGGADAATRAERCARDRRRPVQSHPGDHAAEQHVGGKASSAEYEHEHGRWVFEVEVVKGSEVMDVEVDPTSGKVLSAANDKVDQGDDADREGGGEAND